MLRVLTIIIAVIYLQACASEGEDKYELKSPCVAAPISGSQVAASTPCTRKPINDWWLKQAS